jgi:AT-rich interactive domain-containing protein 1
VTNLNPKDKVTVLTQSESYTKRPRFAEEDVEVVDKDDTLFVHGDDKDWDTEGALMAQGSTHWENGGGNSSDHIVTHFGADLDLVPFVRLLKDLRPKLKQEQDRITDEANTTNVLLSKSNAKNNNNKKLASSDIQVHHPKVNGEIKVENENETKASKDTKKQQQSDNNNSSESKTTTKTDPDQPDVDGDHPSNEDVIEKIERLTGITFRDPDVIRQRWKEEALEDENYVRDEPSLHLVTEANDSLGKRAATVSNILRNLSFVPGNEYELSKSAPFLAICGRLLLLNHWHPPRNAKKKNYDRGEEEETIESCTSLTGDDEWWWEYLHIIRENVMVALSNISGSLELKDFNEDISRPIFNGLLEWAVSTSAYAQDPFPNVGPNSPISPQGLAIETLCKLCLHETNVDLMLTTPPYRRIEKLTLMLAKKIKPIRKSSFA